MSFSARDFRDCLGQFTTGVAVVTTRAQDGAKAGITINSFASVSLDPALVLFSVDHRAATHALFTGDAKRFCINILSQSQKQVSELFSAPGQDGWDKVAYEISWEDYKTASNKGYSHAKSRRDFIGDNFILLGGILLFITIIALLIVSEI